MLLRAKSGELDPEIATWWTRLQELSPDDRITEVESQPGGDAGPRPVSVVDARAVAVDRRPDLDGGGDACQHRRGYRPTWGSAATSTIRERASPRRARRWPGCPVPGWCSGRRCIGRPPFGPVAQPDFVNAVAALLTQLPPHELLASLKQIETSMGRTAPIVRWGPRRIDLDLLAYGDVTLEEPGLTLPHPGIAERAFVLVPLAEIAPDLLVPRVGRASRLLGRVDSSAVVRLDE
jgi:2-amino-4-hydroxy-6-hydroxymethyldihydropteridine diphosphokinase